MIQHFYIAFVLLMLFLQDLFIFASFGCKACLFYWKITLTVWGGQLCIKAHVLSILDRSQYTFWITLKFALLLTKIN